VTAGGGRVERANPRGLPPRLAALAGALAAIGVVAFLAGLAKDGRARGGPST